MVFLNNMGDVKIGQLYRKSTLRDLAGNIINLRDEADGGWIIQNRAIVNQEKYDELKRLEADKLEAARAESIGTQAPTQAIEERTGNPSKLKELEERLNSQDAKLDAILLAINGTNKERRKVT